jgi:hypothetical protein
MAAGKFIHLLAEPIARDTSLKFDREKAIIFPRKNMNGNVWPALEATGLAENGLGFLPWCFWTGAQHVLCVAAPNIDPSRRPRLTPVRPENLE